MSYTPVRAMISLALILVLVAGTIAWAEDRTTPKLAVAPYTCSPADPACSQRATLPGSIASEYIGSYGADGIFRNSPESFWSTQAGQDEIPPGVQRGSIEAVIEDYPLPGHAVKRLRTRSILGDLRDQIVTLAYGHQRILSTPTHVVTDSKQRLIVTDPTNSAVHVLDGNNSFRIQGGPGRRLQHPYAVAVDADDNIYVSDAGNTHVLVYDCFGRFLREIGSIYDEDLFARPSAIAVEPHTGRLYVLDAPMQELIVMSLDGRVISRVGGNRSHARGVKFDAPSEVAVRGNTVAVLDRFGTRLQIFDADLNRASSFEIARIDRNIQASEIGVAIDAHGDIFVQPSGRAELKVYDRQGKQLRITDVAQSVTPNLIRLGLWIDDTDRIFLTDSNTGQVHVFREIVNTQAPVHEAPKAGGGY